MLKIRFGIGDGGGFELGVEDEVGSNNGIIIDKYFKFGVDVDIGDNIGWGVVRRNDSEEFGLRVEYEVDSENDSSVGKCVNDKYDMVFGDSVGIMGLVDMLMVE